VECLRKYCTAHSRSRLYKYSTYHRTLEPECNAFGSANVLFVRTMLMKEYSETAIECFLRNHGGKGDKRRKMTTAGNY